MKKIVCAFVVAIAAIASFVAPASAQRSSGYPHVVIGPFDLGDARIFWSGVIVGGAMTGTYYAIDHVRSLKVTGDGRHFNTGAYGLTTVGCLALSPMVAAAWVHNTEGRPLTSREAMGLGADCVLPFVGGYLINAMYDANPQWEAKAAPARKVRKARRR
jgi:hypothetical protein